jgi:hypothetical protein
LIVHPTLVIRRGYRTTETTEDIADSAEDTTGRSHSTT